MDVFLSSSSKKTDNNSGNQMNKKPLSSSSVDKEIESKLLHELCAEREKKTETFVDNDMAMASMSFPTQDDADVSVERNKKLMLGWKTKSIGTPPKSGKRRSFSDKENK